KNQRLKRCSAADEADVIALGRHFGVISGVGVKPVIAAHELRSEDIVPLTQPSSMITRACEVACIRRPCGFYSTGLGPRDPPNPTQVAVDGAPSDQRLEIREPLISRALEVLKHEAMFAIFFVQLTCAAACRPLRSEIWQQTRNL